MTKLNAFLPVLVIGCAAETATTEQAINTTQVNATSTIGGGTTTQAAVVPGAWDFRGPILRTLDPTLVLAYTGPRGASWSVSTDYATAFAPSFPLQTDDTASPFNLQVTPAMSDGMPYRSSAGKPALVAPGNPGQAVYFTIGNSSGAAAIDIVAAISEDGGRTFGGPGMFGLTGSLWRISEPPSSGADPTGGMVDEPVATAEGQTHVVWVAWSNTNTDFNGGGRRVWVRRLHIDAFGFIDNIFTDHPVEVRIDCNLSCVKFDTFKLAASCSTPSIDDCGRRTSSPGDERIVITFPRVSEGGDTQLGANQTGNACGKRFDVEWRAAISADGGVTWKQGLANADGSTVIDEDRTWPNCIPGTVTAGGNNRGHVPVVHDDLTNAWHFYYTRSISIAGVPHQRIFHTVLDDNFNPIGGGPEEVGPNQVDYNTRVPCSGEECATDQFLPAATTIAPSTASSSHAVAWHDTRRDPVTPRGTMWGAFSCRHGDIGTFRNQELTSGRGVPWAFTGTNGSTPWGDYEGVAADTFGGVVTWYPAWADERLGGPTTQIFSRGWMPDCAM